MVHMALDPLRTLMTAWFRCSSCHTGWRAVISLGASMPAMCQECHQPAAEPVGPMQLVPDGADGSVVDIIAVIAANSLARVENNDAVILQRAN